jgi:DNA-directed RNA polymerase specialized sigma24 family protein
MAARINPRTTIRNFYELTRAVTGQAKVLITCRTHYFKSKSHEEEVLLGETPSVSTQDARELYWDIISRKGYKIAYLQPFSLREIELFVQKALGDQADAAISRIQKTYNLMELSQRPMLLEMIVKSIQSLRGKEINAATLYGVYTDAWIHRDRWRDLLNSTAKLDFVFALARILWSEDLTCVHHSRLSAYIESHFSSQGEHDAFAMVELDSEIRTATFLTRDSSGNYGFAHKSYLEYFLARSVAQNLTMDVPQNALQLRRLSPEVLRFLVQLIRDSKTEPSLEKLICSPYQADISENGLLLLYELRQSQTANEEMVVMPDFIQMRSAKLQQVALSKAVLRSADFSEAFLAESVFSSCDLSGSNFEGAGLQNANLANTRAVSARFRRAKADRCDFQKCNLANADFQEATARSAVFFEAILTNASFEKSDTLGTVFDTAIDPPAAVPATTAFQSLDASVWSAVQQYSLWYSNKFQIDIDDLISSALYTIVNDNRNMEEEMKQDPSAIKSLVRTIAAKERDRMLERFHKRGAIQNVEIDAFDFIGGEEAIEYLPESVLSTGSSDIERRVLVNEILTIMRSLLSDTAYEMINLRFIHGLSDQEIGKIYNSTPTTVSRQIHSALALVRAKLFKDVASDGFASF